MLDRLDSIKISEKSREDMAVANWAWESHWWVEYIAGYYKCKLCGANSTSVTGITKDFPLCKENYAVKKLLAVGKGKVYSPIIGSVSGSCLNITSCPTCGMSCISTDKD